MDDAIIKEIILKIADQYILDKSDKEFLGREHTIYSYYINSNKHIENTVINIINCLKWRRCSLPKYILKYCSNNCEYALKLKNGAIILFVVSNVIQTTMITNTNNYRCFGKICSDLIILTLLMKTVLFVLNL